MKIELNMQTQGVMAAPPSVMDDNAIPDDRCWLCLLA